MKIKALEDKCIQLEEKRTSDVSIRTSNYSSVPSLMFVKTFWHNKVLGEDKETGVFCFLWLWGCLLTKETYFVIF